MPERYHYKNAPIVEALIDIQVIGSRDAGMPLLNLVADRLAGAYPNRQTFSIDRRLPSPDGAVSADGEVTVETYREQGLRLSGNNQIILLRGSGVTFSILAPYDRWESLCDGMRSVWNLYRENFTPSAIARIAVRYINVLALPADANVLDYLRIYPTLPDEMPGGLPFDYYLRLQIPQNDLKCLLNIQSGRVEPPADQPDALAIAFDIELFRKYSVDPLHIANDAEIWDFFDLAHDRKNTIFETSITERVRKIIR